MIMNSPCAFRTALLFVGESWEIKLEDVWVGIGYGLLWMMDIDLIQELVIGERYDMQKRIGISLAFWSY